VVEGAALEMRCTRKGTVGSNPTLSAASADIAQRRGFRYIFWDSGATLAQLVEQCFRKAKVPGSNPGGGSRSDIIRRQ
jgi:hypothetical protein